MDIQNNKATLVYPRVNGESKKKTPEIFSTELACLATPSSNQERRRIVTELNVEDQFTDTFGVYSDFDAKINEEPTKDIKISYCFDQKKRTPSIVNSNNIVSDLVRIFNKYNLWQFKMTIGNS